MIKIPVYLRDMYDAKHLVQAATGCKKDVDLILRKIYCRCQIDVGCVQSADI